MHCAKAPFGVSLCLSYSDRTISVVRDDVLGGGPNLAALMQVLPMLAGDEFVYAGPRHGYAQIALAVASQSIGRRATIFVPASQTRHSRTILAERFGALVQEVPFGRLNVLHRRARDYCNETGSVLLPFGLDSQEMVEAIRDRALLLDIAPTEVWSVAGSGTLQRGLQLAWPHAEFHAVQIGKTPNAGLAHVWKAPEPYIEPAAQRPPFPSCDNYDAKAWQFMVRHARHGAVFWNVAA